jgi:type I restriction enzyme S subunit
MSWKEVPIGELASGKGDFVDGPFGSNLKSAEYVEAGVPIIQLKNIRPNKYLPKNVKYITDAKAAELDRHNYKPGDVAISKLGAVGTACIIPEENEKGIVVADVVRFWGDKSLIDYKYLCYFLNSVEGQRRVLKLSRGTTRIRTNLTDLKKVEIPLPPLKEQKRIAAILDKADNLRRKRQQTIQLADEFLRSVFLDMFGDPVTNPKGYPMVPLGSLCEDLFLGLTSKVDYIDDEGGYPLVRAKDINTGELQFEKIRYISEKQHRKLTKNHLTRKGDLLVSKSGTLGTCAIVKTDREFSTYESIFTVRVKPDQLNVNFLINLMQNASFKKQLLGKKVGGTVSHLNLKMFRDLEFGLPPVDQQVTFNLLAEKIRNKLLVLKESRELGNDFFSSLSQEAFAGKL